MDTPSTTGHEHRFFNFIARGNLVAIQSPLFRPNHFSASTMYDGHSAINRAAFHGHTAIVDYFLTQAGRNQDLLNDAINGAREGNRHDIVTILSPIPDSQHTDHESFSPTNTNQSNVTSSQDTVIFEVPIINTDTLFGDHLTSGH